VRLGYPLANAEAKTGSAFLPRTGLVDSEKPIKDMRESFFRNADPLISDCDKGRAVLFV
jgi:hypothetical protein